MRRYINGYYLTVVSPMVEALKKTWGKQAVTKEDEIWRGNTLKIKEDRVICIKKEGRKRERKERRKGGKKGRKEGWKRQKRKGREGKKRKRKRKVIQKLLARQYDCKNLTKHSKSLSLPLLFWQVSYSFFKFF